MLTSLSTIGMRSTGHARKPPTITTMKVIPTVHQLRTRNFRVTVNHFRNFFRYCAKTGKRVAVQVSWHQRTAEYDDYFLDPQGGRTEVTFLDPAGNQYRGVSECSVEDLYNRKTGVMKAVAKAYADYLADNRGN